MDWKPPDFFFFLFWARTISRVSGSTSEVHSEVGKVGRGLPGPIWEGGTEKQHHSRHQETTVGREGGCPVSGLPWIRADDSPARSHVFSAKGLSSDWATAGQRGGEWALQTDRRVSVLTLSLSSSETSRRDLLSPSLCFHIWETDDKSMCLTGVVKTKSVKCDA